LKIIYHIHLPYIKIKNWIPQTALLSFAGSILTPLRHQGTKKNLVYS